MKICNFTHLGFLKGSIFCCLSAFQGQSGVFWSFLIPGRPDGFLGQSGEKKRGRRGSGNVVGWLAGGGVEWDWSGIQRQGWKLTLDTPPKRHHHSIGSSKCINLCTSFSPKFLWRLLAQSFFPTLLCALPHTPVPNQTVSFFLMCKVEIIIKPSS